MLSFSLVLSFMLLLQIILNSRFTHKMAWRHGLVRFATLTLLAVIVRAQQSCYFPDGSEAVGNSPCNEAAPQSHCCGSTDMCLSNGYCFGHGNSFVNRIIRESCTDQSWDDPACLQHCWDIDGHGKHSFHYPVRPSFSAHSDSLHAYSLYRRTHCSTSR